MLRIGRRPQVDGRFGDGPCRGGTQPLVDAWRTSNPNIVQLWWDVDNAVKTTVRQRLDTKRIGIRFRYRSGMLFIILPSGRQLCYVKPKMGTNKFGGESVTYEGVGTKKWERIGILRLEIHGECRSGDFKRHPHGHADAVPLFYRRPCPR